MFARVAKFEGTDPARLDDVIAGVRSRLAEGPPPGLEGAKEVWMLVDRENRRGLSLTLFESEEALQRGNEVLDAMTPPVPEAGGRRTSVEMYEVVIRETRT